MKNVTLLVGLGISLMSWAGCDRRSSDGATGAPLSTDRAASALTVEALVDHCISFREHCNECRDELVDPWLDMRIATRPDIAKRAATGQGRADLRTIALREFQEDGAGPLADRRKKCQEMVRAQRPAPEFVAELTHCEQHTGCEQWVGCIMPVFRRLYGQVAGSNSGS